MARARPSHVWLSQPSISCLSLCHGLAQGPESICVAAVQDTIEDVDAFIQSELGGLDDDEALILDELAQLNADPKPQRSPQGDCSDSKDAEGNFVIPTTPSGKHRPSINGQGLSSVPDLHARFVASFYLRDCHHYRDTGFRCHFEFPPLSMQPGTVHGTATAAVEFEISSNLAESGQCHLSFCWCCHAACNRPCVGAVHFEHVGRSALRGHVRRGAL